MAKHKSKFKLFPLSNVNVMGDVSDFSKMDHEAHLVAIIDDPKLKDMILKIKE